MRISIDPGTLVVLIREELQVLASSGSRFTAYDVTRSLRNKHPDTTILHAQVRFIVHQYMDELVGTDEYEAVFRNFGWKTAIQYKPAPRQRRRSIPGVPLLPLN